jgi:hypothetical protein
MTKKEKTIYENVFMFYGGLMMDLIKNQNENLKRELQKNPNFFVNYYRGEVVYTSLNEENFKFVLRDIKNNKMKKTIQIGYLYTKEILYILKGNDDEIEYNFFCQSIFLEGIIEIYQKTYN